MQAIKKILKSLSIYIKNKYNSIYVKLSGNEILVLGDSHAKVFKHREIRKLYKKYYLNIVSVKGATISGLTNPNSKTQALPIFKAAITKTTSDKVIVLLGEVDVGFVIWYRAKKYNKDINDVFNETVNNYKSFLLHIKKKRKKIICISCPLPTIGDNEKHGVIANQRRSVTATIKERTDLTIKFNRTIGYFCEKNSIKHVNIDKRCLGTDGNVVKVLVNKDRQDHHYDRNEYAKILAEELIYVEF